MNTTVPHTDHDHIHVAQPLTSNARPGMPLHTASISRDGIAAATASRSALILPGLPGTSGEQIPRQLAAR